MAEAALRPPGERGALVVKNRVVDRIALRAVSRTPGVTSLTSGLAVVGSRLPRTTCVVAGDRVRVDVDLAVIWPQSPAAIADAVQVNVTDDLARLAGLRAESVAVSIDRIVVAGGAS